MGLQYVMRSRKAAEPASKTAAGLVLHPSSAFQVALAAGAPSDPAASTHREAGATRSGSAVANGGRGITTDRCAGIRPHDDRLRHCRSRTVIGLSASGSPGATVCISRGHQRGEPLGRSGCVKWVRRGRRVSPVMAEVVAPAVLAFLESQGGAERRVPTRQEFAAAGALRCSHTWGAARS